MIHVFFPKVVNGAEILEVLHQLPVTSKFLLSLYNCHYADFFLALGMKRGKLFKVIVHLYL